MAVQKLDTKYWMCDFNSEMSLAVVSGKKSLTVTGVFRSENDLGGIIWESVDNWSHANQAYTTSYDFSGVTWAFDYNLTGIVNGLDQIYGPSLTVYYLNDDIKYVRLWNYATGTGLTGSISIDFDNLYSGWADTEPDWEKISPVGIEKLLISFTPTTYAAASRIPLAAVEEWAAEFTSWTLTGAELCDDPLPELTHNYRLADGYDDEYNVTPERYVDHFYGLGFRNIINLYIGASHFYEKIGVIPNVLRDDGYTEYEYELDASKPLNAASEAWLTAFLAAAKAKGFEVILSVSQEMVETNLEWAQKDYLGNYAQTGWTPPPYVNNTFTNSDCQTYYKSVFMALADMQTNAGLPVMLQVGESWWWFNPSTNAPCFYDDATRAAFLADFGYDSHEFATIFDDTAGYESELLWYQSKNGEYAQAIRDYIKATYADAQITILVFPPSVTDEEISGMMVSPNLPLAHWSYPEFDFIQIEDYDWIINDDEQHHSIWTLAENTFGYSLDQTHYFAGFVLTGPNDLLWSKINHAAGNAACLGFAEVFIWAGAQIRRDDWWHGGVMADKLAIYNQAIALLGEMPIASLANTGKACVLLSVVYDYVRDNLLRDHPWNFAITRDTLSPFSTSPTWGYDYQFSVPSDCLKILEIENVTDYTIENNYILCDDDEINVKYIYRNTNTCQYDSKFIEVLAAALAAEICYNLTANSSREQGLREHFKLLLAGAKAVDGQENGAREIIANTWLDSRY